MEEIEKAVEVLNNGGIVIFPTDTAFGIGCRIDKEETIERLSNMLKRPKDMATPVLVSSIDMAQEYLEPIPDNVKDKLIKKYWPGALTIVLPCKLDKVPSLVRGGGQTLGVRIPNYSKIVQIIKEIKVPLLGTSANIHGEKTPYEHSDLSPELIKLVDFVVSGETILKEQSTVIDCSQKPWKILREGVVKLDI